MSARYHSNAVLKACPYMVLHSWFNSQRKRVTPPPPFLSRHVIYLSPLLYCRTAEGKGDGWGSIDAVLVMFTFYSPPACRPGTLTRAFVFPRQHPQPLRHSPNQPPQFIFTLTTKTIFQFIFPSFSWFFYISCILFLSIRGYRSEIRIWNFSLFQIRISDPTPLFWRPLL